MLSFFLLFSIAEKVVFDGKDFPCVLINNEIHVGETNKSIIWDFPRIVKINEIGKINNAEYNVTGILENAFANSKIVEVYVPDTLNFIGKNAFYNCTMLKVISLAETNVTEIADFVFCNCYSLSNLNLPTSIRSLGKYSCSSIGVPIIDPLPETLESIGEGCFDNCSSLLSISLSKTHVTHFPKNLFRGCTKISKIEVPENLTVIGENAFYKASVIEQVFPETIKTIEPYCFYCSSRIQLVNLSLTKVTIIPVSAFCSCQQLKTIVLPPHLVEIQQNAFRNSGITSINIPDTLETIGGGALSECSLLANISLEKTKVKIIPKSLFEDSSSLSLISVPNDITEIGGYAFAGTSITEFVVQDTVTSLGDRAFERCPHLVSCDISKVQGLTKVPPYTFYKCIRLVSYKIPDAVTELDEGCFALCNSFTSFFTNGTKITKIGDKAFMKCDKLKEFFFSPNIYSIGEEAFHHCGNLESVDLSSTKVTEISDSTFSNCISLKLFAFPPKITRIGIEAFDDTSLVNIVLPATVKSIGSKAFSSSKELKSVDISATKIKKITDQFIYDIVLNEVNLPYCIESIDDNAFIESSLAKINMPRSLITIGAKAFAGTRLLDIDLKNTKIRSIGAEAFARTRISTLTFPRTLVELGEYAFQSCSSLTEVNMRDSEITSLSEGVFNDCKELETCQLPLKLEYMNFSSFAYSEIKKLQIPTLTKVIGDRAFEKMDKLVAIEYCGFSPISLISSLNEVVRIYVRKGYAHPTFAGRSYEITNNCPQFTSNESSSKNMSQEVNDSIVILTLTLGFIALAVVIVGVLMLVAPKPEHNDEDNLLENGREEL